MVSRVVAGRNTVHVLAIELQSIKSPIHQDFFDQSPVMLHDALVRRAQVIRVPPGNFSLRTITIQQFVVGMLTEQFGSWYSAQRRPPKLGLESFLVNAIHQGLHVSISVGEFLGIELPITHIILPTVVEGHPCETQALHCRERVIHLLRLNCSAVSPRAPDCTKTAVRSFSHLKTLLHHEASVVSERAEVVSLVDCDESAKSMKTFAVT